ncbi:hypothetical protein SAY87_020253 [Trapa incisa]|uniref:EXPERA domain-containing protein n=1 Tax=Trapa incisa TaxID=236973 RepID=A0AAN7K3M8_9MYRT|nr:hypothetical protein SAY87_020253 [Trapa incisa]
MGALLKLTDAVLFLVFLVVALAAPLLDAQTCLPATVFPDLLLEAKVWYSREYGDYLFTEKPHFFVGLVWLELLFQWPLAIVNLYGILASKRWFRITCLIYGVSLFTSMVAIMSEMVWSQKASEDLLKLYFPFMGFGALAMLRGLVPAGRTTLDIGKRHTVGRKKRE